MNLVAPICLFLLVVVPPIPGQTTEQAAHKSGNPKGDAGGHQQQPQDIVAPKSVNSEGTQDGKGKGRKAEKGDPPVSISTAQPLEIHADVSKDWMDRVGWVFTAALVLIGGIGVFAALKTLREIKRQADLMERQTKVIEGQTKAVEASAASSRLSAQAANSTAESIKNIERAWFVFRLVSGPGSPLFAEFVITNFGKTPGWITELAFDYRIYAHPITGPIVLTPRIMRWENGAMIPPDKDSKPFYSKLGGNGLLTETEAKQVRDQQLFLIMNGSVTYEDVFGNQHKTNICQSFVPDLGWAIHGPKEMNQRT